MTKTLMHLIFVAGMLTSAGAQAIAITVDGNLELAEWGLHQNGDVREWTPNTGVLFTQEDQSGNGNFQLTPGWGGQAYDAEAMYVNWDSNNLYIAIATGHSPETKNAPTNNQYGAGDIAIDFGNDNSWDYGIELLGATKGHIYNNVNWAYGLWDKDGGEIKKTKLSVDLAHPTSILSGTDVGTGSVAYTTVGQSKFGVNKTDLHYFYEIAVPLTAFGSSWGVGTPFEIHWTQNCANDSISVVGTIDSRNQTIPEPGTLSLLPLGLLGLLALRRRKIS